VICHHYLLWSRKKQCDVRVITAQFCYVGLFRFLGSWSGVAVSRSSPSFTALMFMSMCTAVCYTWPRLPHFEDFMVDTIQPRYNGCQTSCC
jgi:hypothetical protein